MHAMTQSEHAFEAGNRMAAPPARPRQLNRSGQRKTTSKTIQGTKARNSVMALLQLSIGFPRTTMAEAQTFSPSQSA
jgi:hypothetical protein